MKFKFITVHLLFARIAKYRCKTGDPLWSYALRRIGILNTLDYFNYFNHRKISIVENSNSKGNRNFLW